MKTIRGLAIAAAFLPAAASADATLEFIGTNVWAASMSADGSVVVGNTQGAYETFRWTSATGVVPLGRATVPVLGVGAGTPDVSADGTRVSATILGADSTYATQGLWEAGVWTETMPPTLPDGGIMDAAYGSAWGLSGDGQTLVGLYWRPGATDGLAHPTKWTAGTGIVDLGTPGRDGRANDANYDGSVIVGWVANPGFGNWWPTVWVNGARTILSTDDWFHEASCVNAPGTIIGGHAPDSTSGLLVGALWRWNGMSWDEELIGALPGHHATFGLTDVHDMTPDGSLVVGYDRRSSPGDATGFVWTPQTGIMSVTSFLSQHGITVPSGFVIRDLSGVSEDGLTICGSGEEIFPPFNARSFLIHLDPPVGAPVVASGMTSGFRLFPNPTRGETTLSLDLARTDRVRVNVHDAGGRLVQRLIEGASLPAGRHDVSWDGRDRSGSRVAPGVYFLRVETTDARESKRLVVVR